METHDPEVSAEEFAPEELARRCCAARPGDTRPFELLVRHYKRTVFATAYRLMGNRQDAEDQAQEVFLKIYRSIKDLDEPATLTAWIYRITINTCNDALRQRRQRPRGSAQADESDGDTDEWSRIEAREPSPQVHAENRELRECLERTLAALEPSERSMIVLRDVEDLPYQEIAKALEVGLSAVKMRIHRARLAFQRRLESLCPGITQGRVRGAGGVGTATAGVGLRTQEPT